MISRLRATIILIGTLLISASHGYSHEITLFSGWTNPGELNLENVRSGLKGSGIYGARFETDFVPIIGLEHTFGYSPNFVRPEGASFIAGERARGIIYNTNIILNAPIGRAIPYVTAGLGLVSSDRAFSAPLVPFVSTGNFGTHFAVNYGGGIKMVRLAGPLGLRFDVRGYSLPDVFGGSLNFFEVSGGVQFTFGGHRR